MGEKGVEASYADMELAARLIGAAALEVGETAAQAHLVMLDPDLFASAVLAPGTFAQVEAALARALDGPNDLTASAARMTAAGIQLRAAAEAYQAADAAMAAVAEGLAKAEAGAQAAVAWLSHNGVSTLEEAQGVIDGWSFFGLGGLGFFADQTANAASFMTKVVHGRWAPRGSDGRLQRNVGRTSAVGRTYGGNVVQRSLRGSWGTFKQTGLWHVDDKFIAKPGQAAQVAKWSRLGDMASKGGTALSAVSGGIDQFLEDYDDPSLSTEAKAARTTATAAATGVGAWGGAWAGASAGAAIGSVFPGPGTAVGAFVGGAIGGFAGSKVGQELGHAAADWAGNVGDLTADGVSVAAETLGDMASGAADAASDVGDALTFWNYWES